jgi:hypothetical protein
MDDINNLNTLQLAGQLPANLPPNVVQMISKVKKKELEDMEIKYDRLVNKLFELFYDLKPLYIDEL